MEEPAIYSFERERMIREQLEPRGIKDPRVLEAMRRVPRHVFVPAEKRQLAYTDGPLPIGEGQTISQPFIVALMTQLLKLQGQERVLEIGTGSGYQAAILARLSSEVFTIERFKRLAENAARNLRKLHIYNVRVFAQDGSDGLPVFKPYDAIVVTAATPRVETVLLEQLADRGRLVAPVGGARGQILECWQRFGDRFTQESILPVAFVPLRGKSGWSEDKWFH